MNTGADDFAEAFPDLKPASVFMGSGACPDGLSRNDK